MIPHETFPEKCDLCHVTGTWIDIKEDFQFDHAAETGYAVLGAHVGAKCLRCHNDRGPVQQFSSLGCRGCHVDPHKGALSSRCDSCHTVGSWHPEGIVNQHLEAGFPLYGSHLASACDSCHPNAGSNDFRGAPAACIACHRKDQVLAKSPDHVGSDFTECDRCHTALSWEGATFPHNQVFPLTGGHAGPACVDCHTNGTFKGTPRQCSVRRCRSWLGARRAHIGHM